MTAPGSTTTTSTGTTGEVTTGEVTGTGTTTTDQLPDDHPLVKTLAAQKTEIKDLKVKAKKLDDLEEAAKTAEQKTAEKIAGLEAEVATVPAKVAEALKEHLVALHKIDKDDSELFLTATDPDLLLKQVARLLERSGTRRKNTVTREGESHTTGPTDDMREFTRELFGKT